jgi:hypothetical protein
MTPLLGNLSFHAIESFLLQLTLLLVFAFALSKIVVGAYREFREYIDHRRR